MEIIENAIRGKSQAQDLCSLFLMSSDIQGFPSFSRYSIGVKVNNNYFGYHYSHSSQLYFYTSVALMKDLVRVTKCWFYRSFSNTLAQTIGIEQIIPWQYQHVARYVYLCTVILSPAGSLSVEPLITDPSRGRHPRYKPTMDICLVNSSVVHQQPPRSGRFRIPDSGQNPCAEWRSTLYILNSVMYRHPMELKVTR